MSSLPKAESHFFQTKLHRPKLASDLVSRPRLLELLENGLEKRLTLVCAPAGFGKTSLVSGWLESTSDSGEQRPPRPPVVWLTLDETDSELTEFLKYFIAALRSIYDDACGKTDELLQMQTRPPHKLIAATLCNDIELLPGQVIVVLDDYHTIRGTEIPALINDLLNFGPDSLHLILISRTNPSLPLSRLRANNQVTEIRSRDLRFSSTETQKFLGQKIFRVLSPAETEQIEQLTDGWIAGLRLAKLTLQRNGNVPALLNALSGTDTSILDYFIEEILAQQLPAIQAFLLRTSVLNRFTPDLCYAVGGEIDPAWSVQACIDWLERTEFFIIPLDKNNTWYRYYNMFLDLLRQRARVALGAEAISNLHRQAADWFAGQGMVEQAIYHAREANDIELAADLMSQELPKVLDREDRPTLERWLHLLPAEYIQSHPELLAIKAWALQFSWQLDAQADVIQQIETLLQVDGQEPVDDQKKVLLGQVYVLKTQHAYLGNQPAAALDFCKKAMELVPQSWKYLRGGILMYYGLCLRAMGEGHEAERFLRHHYEGLIDKQDAQAMRILQSLCFCYLHDGNLEQAYQTARVFLSNARSGGLAIAQSWAHWFLGMTLWEWNDLPDAEAIFSELVDHWYKNHILASRDAITALALISAERGERDKALQMVALLSQFDLERMGVEGDRTLSLRAWLKLMNGDLEEAYRWADEFSSPPNQQPVTWLEVPHITQVRILLARRQPADIQRAHAILEQLEDIVIRTYNQRALIRIKVLRVLAYHAEGKATAAQNTLQKAIKLAQPGGFIRVFVEQGEPMYELLSALARKNVVPAYTISRILKAFPKRLVDPDEDHPASQPELYRTLTSQFLEEPLTAREVDVLSMMREPISFKDIASQLGISPQTVKRHSINIYGKLAVNSRWDAVARAVELEILPAR